MSSDCNFKHGAVIVRGGSVISTGINRFKNHPMTVSPEHIKKWCSVHAEMDAIRKLKDAKGATIYVARIGKMGNQALSRPCNNCYHAIKKAGITKIVYTN
jgi:pyrimidine deaminase RibD-like protein